MTFSLLPPEINSLRMFSGAGSMPMLEAAAAWEGLAGELDSAATSFGALTSGLTAAAWQGPASMAMAAAAAPYASWLNAAAAQAAGAAGLARTVAGVFEAARAATVQPVAVALNRSQVVQLVLSNLFGQNAPAIAAAEGVYEEMWAQDVAAMFGYHSGVSAVAEALLPWQQVLPALASASNIGAANLGLGNIGSLNLGSGNTGSVNFGGGNKGNLNLGSGNANGNLNVGDGNTGSFNLGSGNIGSSNLGGGNRGNANVGFGNYSSTGGGNVGGGNSGSGNVG
ncbi:PPE family protein, partial [Mycobacterium kiyosense]